MFAFMSHSEPFMSLSVYCHCLHSTITLLCPTGVIKLLNANNGNIGEQNYFVSASGSVRAYIE